ncbi:MAG: GNAT family N-acetyltransferase [Planctomycetes bacterium]|nr:GNAT family N-acetyltransferase [Planctomycetota bacterium]
MAEEPWRIEPLTRKHDRDAFACGVAPLDDYLRKYARQNADLDYGRTFVLVKEADARGRGCYTLSAGAIAREHPPPEEAHRLPRYPAPVAHLGRLAVDQEVRGQGLGSLLLADALRRAHRVSEDLALYAVDALAKDAKARQFYLSHGFHELLDDPLHLFLSMRTIAKLFAGEKG